MRTQVFVGILLFLVLGSGCKPVTLGVEPTTLATLQQELDETRAVVRDAFDTIETVIPGGNWNRLIQNLHGGDPERRKEARQFLNSLSGEEVEAQYEVTVEFTQFDDTKPLHAAIFTAPSPRELHLVEKAKSFDLNDTVAVKRTIRKAASQADVEERIGRLLRSAIAILGGSQRLSSIGTGLGGNHVAYSMIYDGALCPIARTDWGDVLRPRPNPRDPGYEASLRNATNNVKPYMDERVARRSVAIEKLEQAIMSVYGSTTTTLGEPGLHEDWDLYSADQYLFIAIPNEDWLAQGEHAIEIQARINQKENPGQTYKNRPRFIFARDDFAGPVETERGQFMWARHAMGDVDIFTKTMTDSLEKLSKRMEAWDAEDTEE